MQDWVPNSVSKAQQRHKATDKHCITCQHQVKEIWVWLTGYICTHQSPTGTRCTCLQCTLQHLASERHTHEGRRWQRAQQTFMKNAVSNATQTTKHTQFLTLVHVAPNTWHQTQMQHQGMGYSGALETVGVTASKAVWVCLGGRHTCTPHANSVHLPLQGDCIATPFHAHSNHTTCARSTRHHATKHNTPRVPLDASPHTTTRCCHAHDTPWAPVGETAGN
jgi:hypothetical protein